MYITRQLWNFRLGRTNLGVQAEGNPPFARFDTARQVESQHFLGGPPCRRERNDFAAIQLKVFRPPLRAWIKQCGQFTTDCIKRSDVGSLETIAVETS
jgi:hypothetical protein